MKPEQPEQSDARFRGHWWGYGVGILIMFTLSGPLLAFVSPPRLHVGGLIAGVIVMCGHWAGRYRFDWDGKLMLVAAFGLLIFGGVISAPVIDDAVRASRANDLRCLAIQKDMLSARPRMANPHDAFQALRCMPQGGDPRLFVPPTDRERAVKKALPHGGYPNQFYG